MEPQWMEFQGSQERHHPSQNYPFCQGQFREVTCTYKEKQIKIHIDGTLGNSKVSPKILIVGMNKMIILDPRII